VAAPTEKDDESMPTQKVFKQRVRARMTKTGESYTAARHQLLRKSAEPDPHGPDSRDAVAGVAPDTATQPIPPDAYLVADASMRRATGKGHDEWFAILDAWGATARTHTEIARWLGETQGVPSWWTQNVTVSYERARGMRARHQMRNGFSVSATRTMTAEAGSALEAFTSPSMRLRWLPDAPLTPRPTRAALTARFDWGDPASRVVVNVVPKGEGKILVSVAHEQLPDAETGERLKAEWRRSLGELKAILEGVGMEENR
jgi:hypothetical protein